MNSFAVAIFLAILACATAFSGPAIPRRAATTSNLFLSRISSPVSQPVMMDNIEETGEEEASKQAILPIATKNDYPSTLPVNSILQSEGATCLTNRYLETINEPVAIERVSGSKKSSIWGFFMRLLGSSLRRMDRRSNDMTTSSA